MTLLGPIKEHQVSKQNATLKLGDAGEPRVSQLRYHHLE